MPIGPGTVYYRWVGDLLHPEREPLAVLERLKTEMGTYDFNAQYLQSPVPLGGNMIQWEWFPYYSDQPRRPEGAIIVQSWDTACTTSELASYSVGITAQINKTGTIHVLDIVRGRWEFTDLVREMRKAAQCHRPKSILIEDQASGTALQQTLKRDGYAVKPIKPKGDKVMRMRVHTPTSPSLTSRREKSCKRGKQPRRARTRVGQTSARSLSNGAACKRYGKLVQAAARRLGLLSQSRSFTPRLEHGTLAPHVSRMPAVSNGQPRSATSFVRTSCSGSIAATAIVSGT